MLLTFLGGAEFVDGAGRLFRRAADGTFLGADLDNLEAWCYSGAALTAAESKRLEGDMQQGASEWKWVVSGHELERGAKITVKQKVVRLCKIISPAIVGFFLTLVFLFFT